jgi:hypothetical protein
MAKKFFTDENGRVRPMGESGVPERKEDLMLGDLNNFAGGSDRVYNIGPCNITDGVKYIMNNGYGWMVTDAAATLKMHGKVKDEPFVVVKLSPQEDGGAIVTYGDGNGKILYRQKYEWSDAKREVKLYYSAGTLMLPVEY